MQDVGWRFGDVTTPANFKYVVIHVGINDGGELEFSKMPSRGGSNFFFISRGKLLTRGESAYIGVGSDIS